MNESDQDRNREPAAELRAAKGPRYWRTLEELAQTPDFVRAVEAQFPGGEAELMDTVNRRDFLKLASVTLALAGLTACTKQPLEPIVPYVQQPEGIVLGKPNFYATAMPLGGIGRPMLVKSHEGRPTKIEGNPQHPASLGGSDVFSQASLYDLYDPDRSQTIQHLGDVRTWGNFIGAVRGPVTAQLGLKGAGIRILTQTVTSPTLAWQIRGLLKTYPAARWHQWEPVNRDNVKLGAQMAYGRIVETHYRIDQADVVISLDADFLNSTCPGFQTYARQFASRRDPESGKPMLRFYAVESTPTNTGAKADHVVRRRASEVVQFAHALLAAAGIGGEAGISGAGMGGTGVQMGRDLAAHPGSSLVIAGDCAPPEVHALAHELNARLGNVGKTVFYTEPIEPDPQIHTQSLAALMEDIVAKRVDVLLILGGNPVFDAPADAGFAQNISSVPLRIHVGTHFNETAEYCHWHINQAHYLESWSDVRAHDGTASIIQPLIAPLYGGKTAHEVLAAFTANPDQSSYEIVRAYWEQRFGGTKPSSQAGASAGNPAFEKFWRRALHDGFVADTALKPITVSLKAKAGEGARAPSASQGEFEIVFRPDPTLYDGRFGNNAWLQELPKPISSVTWDNPVWMNANDAKRLGVTTRDVVEISVGGSRVQLPVYVQPGQPEGAVTVFLGGGHTRLGHTANGAGVNVYPLRANATPWTASGKIERVAGAAKIPIATIQPDQFMANKELVRVATLEEFHHNPKFAREEAPGPPPGLTLYPEVKYDGYKWGMSIDLNKCVGCNSCVVACQAENNIPVVGKKQVLFRRPMHWLRVDTYYEGSADNPRIFFQPLPCMQCENAPCEYVCPVHATVHSTEGLNDMVYNRCVGTRYCANNCPYKVRRFNFLLYQDWTTPQFKMMRNPDVTVRSRGVMEKCTYCVQRITRARIEAEEADRRIVESDFTTACAQACPADAIVFGDINDKASRVGKRKQGPREYGLLTELNTRPRTTYTAGVRNPNPELEGERS